MIWAILTTLLVLAHSAEIDSCPCRSTADTSCPEAALNCKNGGIVPQCVRDGPCLGPDPVSHCQCPNGYAGAQCDIIEPGHGQLCHDGQQYDDSVLNTAASKSLECQATITTLLELADLQDHRIDVWLDLPHHLANVSLWTRTRNQDGNTCGPMLEFFQCAVSECVLLANTSGTFSTLSCPKKSCSVCTDDRCPVALQSIIQSFQDKDTPLTLLIDPTQRHHSNMTVTLDALVLVEIPLTCITGSCVDKIAYEPSSSAGSSERSDLFMMIIGTSSALAMYGVLAFLGVIVNMELRHPPKIIKSMIMDHAHDSVKITPNQNGSDYNLLHSPCSTPPLEDAIEPITVLTPGELECPRAVNNGNFGLVWQNVNYKLVRGGGCSKRSTTQILSNSTGVVRPGEMVAVLGASGAGKSTLLDILGGIEKKGSVSGQIRTFGDYNARRQDILSYLVQDDYNLSTMTVWETLAFSARTRLPPGTSDEDIMKKVRSIIEELALVKVAATKVGTVERGGISGGERRRLAIGVELIAEPCILLADEPTSGLDSFYAEVIVRALRRRAAEYNCAVLITIHQPPAHLFPLFDKVLLMCRGGTMAFNGHPGKAIEFFELETGNKLPAGANPFEFLVETLSNRTTAFNNAIVRKFTNSQHYRDVENQVESCVQSEATVQALPKLQRQMATPLRQCWLLTMRSFRHCARDPSLLLMYNCVTLIVAFLSGLIFFQLDNRIVGSQNRIGFLFFTILFMSLLNMSSMGHFVLDRILLWRERYSGFYSTGTYFIAKLVVDLIPFRVLPPVLYSCISYWLVGLRPDLTHFLSFVGVLVLTNLVSGASVFLISASSSNLGQANLFGILYFIYAMVFGGLLLNASSTNTILSRLSCTSFINYAYSAIMSNEFHGLRLQLDPKGFGNVKIEMDGDVILQNFGFDWRDFGHDVTVLSAAFISVTVITFFILRYCQIRRK